MGGGLGKRRVEGMTEGEERVEASFNRRSLRRQHQCFKIISAKCVAQCGCIGFSTSCPHKSSVSRCALGGGEGQGSSVHVLGHAGVTDMSAEAHVVTQMVSWFCK